MTSRHRLSSSGPSNVGSTVTASLTAAKPPYLPGKRLLLGGKGYLFGRGYGRGVLRAARDVIHTRLLAYTLSPASGTYLKPNKNEPAATHLK